MDYADDKMLKLSFSRFIRSPWLPSLVKAAIDSDPLTHQPFKSIIHLRTARIKNMLSVQDLAKYAYFINYETLYVHPQEVMQEIHEIFNIPLNEIFIPILDHFIGSKNTGVPFKESEY